MKESEKLTLDNYVKLEMEKEKVLRFKPESFRIEPREILDPLTKVKKTINAAVLDVIEEDGRAVAKTLTIFSDRLASGLKVAHDNGTLYGRRISITKTGEGFRREYTLKIF